MGKQRRGEGQGEGEGGGQGGRGGVENKEKEEEGDDDNVIKYNFGTFIKQDPVQTQFQLVVEEAIFQLDLATHKIEQVSVPLFFFNLNFEDLNF